MTQPNSLIKIGVLVSSVLLVGGAIAYRAGAFDQFLGSGSAQPAPTMMPSSKLKVLIDPPAPTPPEPPPASSTQPAPAILWGSKSAPVISPTSPDTSSAPLNILISGSKSSIAPVIVVPTPAPRTVQPPANSQAPAPPK